MWLVNSQSCDVSERPRPGFRFTPMMSVLIGVVSALLIVAVVVGIVLRLQCSHNEDRRKQHKAAAHEQRNRGSSSGGGGSGGEKGGSSPINKLDPGGTESGDSDEKNPDIIPQPSNGKSNLRTVTLSYVTFMNSELILCLIEEYYKKE